MENHMGKYLGQAEDFNDGTKAQDIKAQFVGLYFSAHWCPPCRSFTPELSEFYNKVNESEKRFEVIFISSDSSETEFNEYFAEMPWKALKFEQENREQIKNDHGVSGIPTLVIYRNTGSLEIPKYEKC